MYAHNDHDDISLVGKTSRKLLSAVYTRHEGCLCFTFMNWARSAAFAYLYIAAFQVALL
jgi:hypothetical protein